MRELLTGLAVILIVVLTTILVAPYFVDWNGQRGFLEARLTRALGQPVTIGGNIDLKLLPTPYLVLDQVVVGGDESAVRIGIHHLDLELSAAPLMHGEFDITEARLKEPTLRVTLQPDHTLPALPRAPAFAADVRFDRIHVSDGTLAIADPSSGHTFLLDHLDFDADAASFAGPFKLSGAEGSQGARTGFRLSTATPQNGHTHARLIVDETPIHAAYDLDGSLSMQAAGADAIRPTFEGAVKLTGHLVEGSDVSIPWKLSGPFKADSAQAALDDGELRLGGEDRAVTLTAKAKGDFGESPSMSFDLSAKQLDIDRLSPAPVDATKPLPPKLPDLLTLRRLLGALHPPIRTGLDLYVETATYGGDTLSELQAHLALGEATQPLKVSVDGPGGSRVAVDGRLSINASPAFTGSLALSAENLPRAVEWLAGVAPSFPWKKDDLQIQTLKLDGEVKADRDSVDGDKLSLTLDRTVLKGKAHVSLADGSKASKIVADLIADPLDLETLPSFFSWRGAGPFDLDLQLDAKALKVSRAGEGALETGRIGLAFTKTGSRISLKRLRAVDLGGATVDASGRLDPQHANLSLTLEAMRLGQFAGLVRQLAPGAVADALVERAPTLAPAKIKIDVDLTAPGSGVLVPSRLAIAGTLGDTKVDVATKPDSSQANTENPAKVASIAVTLAAPDSGALLAQLGFKTLPLSNIGNGHISFAARSHGNERIDTTLGANFGATKLDATGRLDIRAAMPAGSGTLRIQSPDVTPLLQSLAIAFPDMTRRVPVDLTSSVQLAQEGPAFGGLTGRVAGIGVGGALAWHADAGDAPALTGSLNLDTISLSTLIGLALGQEQVPAQDESWSHGPFAAGLADPPHSAIALKAKALEITPGLTATNAGLDLDLTPNLLKLGHLKAELYGGHIEGDARLRRDGAQATVEGKVALDHVAIDLPGLRSHLSGHMDLAGGGTSSFALVSSLAGAGEATADDLMINGAYPKALPKIFDEIENDVLAVDEETVARAFADDAKPPLTAGTRRFGLSLAAGDIHFTAQDPGLPAQGPVATKVEGSFDLARMKADAHVEETLLALPKNWNGLPPIIVVTFQDVLRTSSRTYDVSAFLNAVAARALARETARVETYEFDIRERAFFNARLQTERRREQERLLAEENARKAEEERKTRVEAQRQERLRQQQEKDKGDDKDKNESEAPQSPDGTARTPDVPSRQSEETRNRDQGRNSSDPPRPPRRPAFDERSSPSAATASPPRRPDPALTDPSTFGRY